MDHQKSTILWIFGPLSVGGCGGHGCYFQPILRVISQMSASQKYTDTLIVTYNLFLVGLRGLQSGANQYERPCIFFDHVSI